MKKLISVFALLLLLIPCFADGFFLQANCGYGGLSGSRYMSWSDGSIDNKVALKATGIEAGVLTGWQFENNLGVELYFDYLFALRGSYDPEKAPAPTVIPEKVRFTDYKAGIGAQYRIKITENDSIRLATGLNFTGISNHYYKEAECKNQIDGHKVTSFGFYFAVGEIHKLSNHFSITANIHTCLNPFGFLRNFDSGKGKWINFLPKDGKPHVKCASAFAQLGIMYTM